MIVILSSLIISFLMIILTLTRLAVLCHFFQQEEYDTKRFLSLVFKKGRLVDKKLSFFFLILIPVSFFLPMMANVFLISVGLLVTSLWHVYLLRTAKKALVYTKRVQRILSVSFLLATLLYAGLTFFSLEGFFLPNLIIFLQLIPFILVGGNLILKPYEEWVQKKYYGEAVAKLQSLQPIVIGITGSYGKTSVKHILAHILSQVTPTLATPGSVNTVMGITRIIREKLNSAHRYFIAEMGAYGPGSIKNLCDFCPPDHGILTAVGNAHYERFKDIDKVAEAKFELWRAVERKKGFFVINSIQVDQSYIKLYVGKEPKQKNVILVDHEGKQADFTIKEHSLSSDGLTLNFSFDGLDCQLTAPLFGSHQVVNIMVAVAFAYRLGVPMKTIEAGLKTIPQIKHRLEVIHHHDGPDVIDDSYNANPDGFSSALEVLKILGKKKGGRKILVTPGMVELGALHSVKHTELGEKTAAVADIVLLVRGDRFPTFEKAIKAHQAERKIEIITCKSFLEAKEWLRKNVQIQDVILYENDLPDLYESTISL